jgi:phosphogluconate dehydratase
MISTVCLPLFPLLTRIYPNGEADVNHFHAAGGTGFVIRELLDAGLLHDDVTTILGKSLRAHCTEPFLLDEQVVWKPSPDTSADENVLRPADRPFAPDGGLRLLTGNLGRAVVKISAVKPEHHLVEAPAIVFKSQEEFMHAYQDGKLNCDFVAVVRFQGPKANGMPELHALTPALGSLQDAGYHVALVTDGRMSGASGKVPAAIHVSPEVLANGPLGRVRNGDIIRLDAESGTLQALVAEEEWQRRPHASADLSSNLIGMGRELFAMFRASASVAEEGAATFGLPQLMTPSSTEINLPKGDAEPFSDEDTHVQQSI